MTWVALTASLLGSLSLCSCLVTLLSLNADTLTTVGGAATMNF